MDNKKGQSSVHQFTKLTQDKLYIMKILLKTKVDKAPSINSCHKNITINIH
jgi:hypothetical protein